MPTGSGDGAAPQPQPHPRIKVFTPDGRQIERLVLFSQDTPGRKLRVYADPDCQTAFLQIEGLRADSRVTVAVLRELLKQAGVVHGLDMTALGLIAEQVATGGRDTVGPFEVARATLPRHGRDGYLHLEVLPTSTEPRYETDAAGNVDYQRLHLFENVLAGQCIAKLMPPTTGEAGQDIMGRLLPASDGGAATIRVGPSVTLEEETARLFADADGRVEFTGERISVATVYEVHGDVDLNVGIIDFVGEVVIHGAVREGFDVRGAAGVTIDGPVEACVVQSEGDVRLLGGMSGKKVGRISAGGDVEAKYLDELLVEAHGSLTVQKEIVNCAVRASGSVQTPGGAIVGGRVIAFGGVEAGDIGSDLGTATHIECGLDWNTETRIEAIDARIEDVGERIDQADAELMPILGSKMNWLNLGETERSWLRTAVNKLKDLRKELVLLEDERAALSGEIELEGRVTQVNIVRQLYAGTVIRFPHFGLRVKDAHKGPISVLANRHQGRVEIKTCQPLPHFENDEQGRHEVSESENDGTS